MDFTSSNPENYKKLIENTTIVEKNNFLKQSEYRIKYDGKKLYIR